VSTNLNTAALLAGLSEEERRQVEGLNKTISAHRTLSNLPQEVAQQKFNSYTQEQQNALRQTFGEDEVVPKKRGWLGTAGYYASRPVVVPFQIAGAASNLMTRIYRTGVLASTQPLNLAQAWETSGKDGEKLFNPERIEKARSRFGNDEIEVAMKIAGGSSYDSIITDPNAPAAQKAIASRIKNNDKEAKLFQDTLDSVQAAKYSPGRQAANLVTPEQLEGSGFYYRAVSGAVDAAYRIFADPFLLLGKAKKAVDVSRYSLDVLMGNQGKTKWWQVGPFNPQSIDEVFERTPVRNFWDAYGVELNAYKLAKEAGDNTAQVAARNNLARIAPEFGPSVIDEFISLPAPIKDADSAKAYFKNSTQVLEILKGQPGRTRVLMPRLDARRRTRIAFYTTANKLVDIDKSGNRFVNDLYFGAPTTNDGIVEKLVDEAQRKEVVAGLKKLKGKRREIFYSSAAVQYRIDRFKAKFSPIPMFDNGSFDVLAKDASEQIYRLSRLALPQYYSKSIREAFVAGTEGERKEIFYGLWQTIADFRGMNMTEGGRELTRLLSGKYAASYAATADRLLPDGTTSQYNPSVFRTQNGADESMALIPSQLSSFVSAPSIKDIDRFAARSGLGNAFSFGSKAWVEKMTSYWSFLTLAGPRYALRNATEDLMVHLAIGNSPWGLAKAKVLSTRLRTAAKYSAEGGRISRVAADPLGVVNRLVRAKDRAKYQQLMKDAGGDIQKMRGVLATAVSESKLGRMGIVLADDEAEYLKDIILSGNIDNALADVVEGGKNLFTGSDFASRALLDEKRFGRMSALKINIPARTKYKRGTGFTNVAPLANTGSQISWMLGINFWANDRIGALAIANLDNEALAIIKIKEALNSVPGLTDRFRLYAPGVNGTIDDHAQRVYDAAKQLFVKQNGKDLNMELLDKVRKIDDVTGEYKVAGELGLDDLPTNAADAPLYINGPTLVPVADTDNYTASIMERGWDWFGEQNARFSREPMVLQEMIKVRREMDETGFYNAFIAAHTKGITDPKDLTKATEKAKAKVSEIIEERARARTLAYVDNPLLQSQLAFNSRNFARFYRATEDFYRRVGRVVRYNPEAISRIAITYEGIAHSGWVQKDDQGELYFIYPGLTPVYKAMTTVLTAFGVPASFRIPTPVEFGGKLNMITPSANPESLIPTFAGPAAAFPIKIAENLLNTVFDKPAWADTLVRTTLGKYAEDQPTISALLPAHVNKVYGLLNKDERNSQYASAFRKAVTYLEATGHGVKPRYAADGSLIPASAGELEDYREKLRSATMAILSARVLYGLFAPASPQIMLKSDMADWVRDNGTANWKQSWNAVLAKNNGDIDKAMETWIKYNPKDLPFTITESERSTVALVRYADASGRFVEENDELFNKYPQGAAFLIPYEGDFSWDAYQTMRREGLRYSKRMDDFLREVQTANDLQVYYSNKENYETALENSLSDFQRRQYRERWKAWSDDWKNTHPLIQEELAQGGQREIERRNSLLDLTNMLNDPTVTVQPKTRAALTKMVNVYNDYVNAKTRYATFGAVGSRLSDSLLAATITQMKEIAATNSNADAAYNVLFSRLLD
jgi:hypothetical protein